MDSRLPKTKPQNNSRTGHTKRTDTAVDNQQEAGSKRSGDKEDNQPSRREEQEGTCTFFSKSVLHTQHEIVAPYPEPITDLLLVIDGQGHEDTHRHSHIYRKWIHLHGPNGEKVRMQAVIDGGAMKNTMCTTKWHAQKHRLTPLSPSKVTLTVADNRHILSEGQWTGIVDVVGTKTTQSFEVFNSHGAFQVILGKPWLSYVQAVHRYDTDQITFRVQGLETMISNDEATQDREHAPGQKDNTEASTDGTRQMGQRATGHEEEPNRRKEGREAMTRMDTKANAATERCEKPTDARHEPATMRHV